MPTIYLELENSLEISRNGITTVVTCTKNRRTKFFFFPHKLGQISELLPNRVSFLGT